MLKNNIHRKKLPAFTVIELLIVMLLSGIVVGLTFMYFTQFQSYLRQMSTQSADYIELGQLTSVLERDINHAEKIFFSNPDQLELMFGDESVQYTFESQYVLRKLEKAKDTFHFRTIGLDVEEMDSYNDLVRGIDIQMEIHQGEQLQFCFRKDYPSKTLFLLYDQKK